MMYNYSLLTNVITSASCVNYATKLMLINMFAFLFYINVY
jgi:hypothetical protein